MFVIALLLCITVVFLIILCLFLTQRKLELKLNDDHFLITGGSSGIGLAFAIAAARRGASVTLLARNKERLHEAKTKVASYAVSSEQKFCTLSVDVSEQVDFTSYVEKIEDEAGPITFLANCAGTSVCYHFEETPDEELKKMMNLNYFGSVKITRAVVPLMKSRGKGKIVFCSSLAGLVGLYGYSAYSASKFAIVGMAQALQMEVKPFNISVTVCFPPDTDTPGFAEEIKTKLSETQLISESGGLFSAEDVAENALSDAMKNRFMSSLGFEGRMLCALCCGMSPAFWADAVLQVFSMGIFRVFGYIYLHSCDKIIKKCSPKEKTQ